MGVVTQYTCSHGQRNAICITRDTAVLQVTKGGGGGGGGGQGRPGTGKAEAYAHRMLPTTSSFSSQLITVAEQPIVAPGMHYVTVHHLIE